MGGSGDNLLVSTICCFDKYSTTRKYWCIFRDTAMVESQFVSPEREREWKRATNPHAISSADF